MKKKKISHSAIPKIYSEAIGFHKIYKETKKLIEESLQHEQYADYMPSTITNACFAAELYLKMICAVNDWEKTEREKGNTEFEIKYPGGHHLHDDLYMNLDEETKNRIKENLPSDMTEEEFLEKLKIHDNSFVDWRYYYEKDELKGNLQFLGILLNILLNICTEYLLVYQQKTGWTGEILGGSVILSEEKCSVNEIEREIENPINKAKNLTKKIIEEKISNGSLNRKTFEVNGNLDEIENYKIFFSFIVNIMECFQTVFGQGVMSKMDIYVDNATEMSGYTPITTKILGKYIHIKLGIDNFADAEKIVYQFSHELCHCVFYSLLGIGKKRADAQEENICTAMSLIVLKAFFPNSISGWEKHVSSLKNENYNKGVEVAKECDYNILKLKDRIYQLCNFTE